MAFSDVINDYSDGATGSLNTTDGGTVGYTVTGTSPNTDWQSLEDGARVNGTGTQQFEVEFNDPVLGAVMQVSGGDSDEQYFIVVDGVTVDLNTLVADGSVTLTQPSTAQTYTVNSNGSVSGGTNGDGAILEIQFNIPVTSLGAFGDGAATSNWDFFEVGISDTSFTVVCFAKGTKIRTPEGDKLIETLEVGDMVSTLDRGPQPLRWIGGRTVPAISAFAPVRIKAGALGNTADLLVSPEHRMLISDPRLQLYFDTAQALVAAKDLVNGTTITREEDGCITYMHMLFDNHEIVWAEDCPSEALLVSDKSLAGLTTPACAEILALFPELDVHNPKPSRPCLSSQEGQLLKV